MRRTSRAGPTRLDRILHHPRTSMAFKAAVAATIAWLIAQRLPGPAQEYPYYAPLGAVTAMYPTAVSSFRESLQGVASILLGASLAVVVDAVLGGGPLLIAIVVGLGTVLAGARWLGDQRAYVPTAALFVLIIGSGDDVGYAAAFAGLFLLGAAVSVGLNLLLPSLSLPRVDAALDGLRAGLAVRLRSLADQLEADPSEEPGPALPRTPAVSALDAARDAVHQAQEATHGNLRARRWPDAVPSRVAAYQALERVAFLVDDLHGLLDGVWHENPGHAPEALRHPAAAALRALESAVTVVGVHGVDPAQRVAIDAAIEDLTRALRTTEHDGAPEMQSLVFGSIITSLLRCSTVLAPPDLRASSTE